MSEGQPPLSDEEEERIEQEMEILALMEAVNELIAEMKMKEEGMERVRRWNANLRALEERIGRELADLEEILKKAVGKEEAARQIRRDPNLLSQVKRVQDLASDITKIKEQMEDENVRLLDRVAQANRVLRLLDELLEKLPEEEIRKFARSKDFEVFSRLLEDAERS